MRPRFNICLSGKSALAAGLSLLSFQVLAAEEQATPELTAMPMSDPGYLLQVFISLAVVIAVIVILSLLIRKFDITTPRAEGPVRVLHTVSLGGKEQLLLVAVGDEQILLGRSPGSITRVHKLAQPVTELEGIDQLPNAANLFGKIFNRSMS